LFVFDEEEEHLKHRIAVPPPLVNRTYELPTARPFGPSVLQELRDRDAKTTSSTPLIVSHSPGLSLAYLEAGVYSELLPPEGVTFLSISGGGGALLPPPDSILGLPALRRKVDRIEPAWGAADDHLELTGRSVLGMAAVWRGIVSRVFSVSPATDLRDLLLINAGDVTFKHFARTEPESSQCRVVAAPQPRQVQYNFSSHVLDEITTDAHEAALTPPRGGKEGGHKRPAKIYKLQGRLAANLELDTAAPTRMGPYGNESVQIMTSFAVAHGERAVCCGGCLPAALAFGGGDTATRLVGVGGGGGGAALGTAAGAATREEDGGALSGPPVALAVDSVTHDGPQPRGAGRLGVGVEAGGGGRGEGRNFSAWRGELADADRQREVEYDGQLLVDSMVPLGPYVLSLDLSYFSDVEESRPPADECHWLIRVRPERKPATPNPQP
jgi:hypothetical protein